MNSKYAKKIQQFISTLAVKKVQLHKDELTLIIKNAKLKPTFILLKNHAIWQYKTLVNVNCIEYPKKSYPFSVTYDLLSYRFNSRIRVKVFTDSLTPVASLQSVFSSAGWSESEVWDMFGVFFSGHSKLKRLLTDYGFEGYPLKKDYPLSGFEEVYYDYETKTLKRCKIELSQDSFDLKPLSPWKIPEIKKQ